MKIAYIIIVVLHGLIHLIGPAKAMGWAESSPLQAPISRPMGLLWLLAALCTLGYAFLFGWKVSAAWMVGLVAVILSQALIIIYWSDARFGTVANLIMLVVILFSFGEWRFQQQAKQAENTLLRGLNEGAHAPSKKDTARLPESVKNWLISTGALEMPLPARVELRQGLQLKTAVDQESYFPARARQTTRIDSPGFLWLVEVEMNPVLWMRGRDSYQSGKGAMNIWLNSLIPVVREAGPKIDEGALQRFLGEMVWMPQQALQPYIEWESINERQARASMLYGGVEAGGIFTFRENGDFERFEAMRFYGADPDGDRKPWILTVQEYAHFEGVRVPSRLEATWELETGAWTWLKLEVEEIQYKLE